MYVRQLAGKQYTSCGPAGSLSDAWSYVGGTRDDGTSLAEDRSRTERTDSTLVTKNTKSREKKGNTHDFVFATRFIVYSVLLVAMTVFCQVGAEYPGLELLR